MALVSSSHNRDIQPQFWGKSFPLQASCQQTIPVSGSQSQSKSHTGPGTWYRRVRLNCVTLTVTLILTQSQSKSHTGPATWSRSVRLNMTYEGDSYTLCEMFCINVTLIGNYKTMWGVQSIINILLLITEGTQLQDWIRFHHNILLAILKHK